MNGSVKCAEMYRNKSGVYRCENQIQRVKLMFIKRNSIRIFFFQRDKNQFYDTVTAKPTRKDRLKTTTKHKMLFFPIV